MKRSFVTSPCCWLAASGLVFTVLAETAPKKCAGQECEIEDSSLLSIRRDSSRLSSRKGDPSPTLAANTEPSPTPAPDVCVAGGRIQAGDADDVQVFWQLTPLGAVKAECEDISEICVVARETCVSLCEWMQGLYHAGIGFKNVNTGHKSHAEFFADHFGIGMINPQMDQPVAGQWSWKGRDAAIHVYEQWDTDDDWTSSTHVATIKGSHYNSIVSWMCSDLKNDVTKYVLFSLATPSEALPYQHQQHVSGEVVPADAKPGSRPPGSSTCMDAAALILQKIKDVAGSGAFEGKDIKQVVNRDDTFQLMEPGTSVRKLDMNNKEDYAIAYKYFSFVDRWMKEFSTGAFGLVAAFAETSVFGMQSVYTDINDDYWTFTPNGALFAMYHESAVPAV